MSKKLFFVLIVTTIILSGCATIMNGDMVNVPVYTTPSGATVVINGATYASPATVMVPRGKGDFKLHIEKEGYEPVDIMLTQSVDGWLWGNVLFGGLIGLAVDFISGDAYDLDPELVSANLRGVNVSQKTDGALQFVLVDINQLPKSVRDKIKRNSHKQI